MKVVNWIQALGGARTHKRIIDFKWRSESISGKRASRNWYRENMSGTNTGLGVKKPDRLSKTEFHWRILRKLINSVVILKHETLVMKTGLFFTGPSKSLVKINQLLMFRLTELPWHNTKSRKLYLTCDFSWNVLEFFQFE